MRNAQITKLFFIMTGSYQDMALRPYTARATGEDIDRLDIATEGFRNLSTGALAGVAGSILRPSTVDVGTLSIDNGWNSQRYMFMMEVIYPSEGFNGEDEGALKVQYITGYTDTIGDRSYTGKIDPRMRLYLCNVITTRQFQTTRGYRRRGISANRYIQQNGGQTLYGNQQFYAMRPRDICNTMGHSGLGDYVDVDYRNSLTTHPLLSNVKNDLPTDYLNRTFESFRQTVNDVNSYAEDIPSLMNSVAGKTGDEGAVDDPFVMNLYRNTELAEGSSFSYGELCSLFPGTDQIAHVPSGSDRLMPDIGFDLHRPNDSENWFGSKNETIIASIAGSAIPALMVSCLLTQAAFLITNETVDGQPYFEWLSEPASFMMDGELIDQAEHFKGRMVMEIFRDMTRNGNIQLSLRCMTDLVMSDTRMEITVDGGITTPYTVPNFAAGLITPVIANHRDQLDTLATEVNNIFDEMGSKSRQVPGADEFSSAFQIGGRSLGSALKERNTSRKITSMPSTGNSGWKV